jgi:hypothetical protein
MHTNDTRDGQRGIGRVWKLNGIYMRGIKLEECDLVLT